MKKYVKGVLVALAVIASAVLALKGSVLIVQSGSWSQTGNLSSARVGASAALLPDGRILVTGGDPGTGSLATADFFGTDGTISAAPPMVNARSQHVSVTMQDGRILVAGGLTAGGSATNAAEIYDPVANSWTSVGTGMIEARSGATAGLLLDGRVAIAGGQNGTIISSTIEIFDPTHGTFTSAGAMSSPRTQHAMAVLLDGRVLIVGGNSGTTGTPPAPTPVASTDIFDPVAGTVSAGPSLATPRYNHSATTLLNGQVVVIGGNNGNANPAQMDVTPAELVDFTAVTPAFTTLATNLATPREGHLAILLPNNNNVLIAGGTSAGTTISSAELFTALETPQDVWTYAFGSTGSMITARSSATGSANQVNAPSATMQRNGVVMVAGGNDASGKSLNTTEAYGFPTVQTDASDYPPFTTVTITGSGFQPGETITLTLVESPLIDTGSPFTTVADANGNFSDNSFATDSHDVSVRFYLTATGQTSGFQAENAFTDNADKTTTDVTCSPNPVEVNTATTCTATVTDGSPNKNPNPQGTVQFSFSGTGTAGTFVGNPCTLSASSTCLVSVTLTPAAAVSGTVTGAYSPSDATKWSSSNGTFALTVAGPANKLAFVQQPTNTEAGSSITPAVTVNVEDASGNVVTNSTASVALAIGTNSGGGTLSGTTTVNAVNGVATFSGLSINKTGNGYTLAANSTGLTAATSNTFNITSGTATQLVFGQQPTNAVAGSSITPAVTVQVEDANNNVVTTSAASVTVAIGSNPSSGTLSGTKTVNAVNGVATFNNLSINNTGSGYTLTASSAGLAGATSNTFSIGQASTTTALTSSANPSVFGQSVTFTATLTVNSPGTGTIPAGETVTFKDGGAAIGTGTTNASGVATFATSTLAVATHTITAVYTGDTNFATSTSTAVSQVVNQASTTTALTSSVNPSVFGQSVTFTATVTVNSPGAGTIPAGETVTFKDGTTAIGTGTTNASGVATFVTSTLSVATHTITAVYASDTNFAASTSTAVSQVVNKASTTTTITNDLSTATVVGQAYSVAVSVAITAPGAGTIPNGDTVTVSDGSASCTVPLSSAAGSCSLTSTTAGGKTITATYNGDANFNASTSTGVAHTVNKASTTTTITSNTPNPSTVGQSVTINYSVTVNAPGAGTPTGNVTVSDGAGDTCTANVATGTCSITFNTAGTKNLIATYAGDTNFNTSASTGTSQTVNPKLAFTSTAFAILTGTCSSTISVQIENANGSAATLTSPTVLSLSSSSGTGKFFSDSTCTTQITTATITAGSSTANFFYDDTTIGSPVITVASTGLTSVTQPEAITGLIFDSNAFSVPIGVCSSAITLQSANSANGGPTVLTLATTINLTSTSGGGKFYSNSTCTTQITTTSIGPGIDGGHDSNSFFYEDSVAGSPTLKGSAGTASATQTESVMTPPTISKAFSPASIPVNGTSTITFTLTNPAVNTTALTNVAFSDTFPTTPGALVVASPTGVADSCGGTVTAIAGAGSVSLSGGTIPAGTGGTPGTCAVSVNVTPPTAGTYNNTTGPISSASGGTGATSNTATLNVLSPPTIIKVFGAATIPVSGTTSLSFTITNPTANTVSLTGVGFSDPLPSGLVVTTPNGLSGGTCATDGGSITANQGGSTIILSGATVPPNSSCSFSVNVTGTTSGVKNNTTSTVTSTNGGTGNTASASITVASPPTISKAFGAASIPLNASTSLTFNITNPNTISLSGLAFSDTLPPGLIVATPSNGLSNTCGGTPVAIAGSGTVSLTSGAVAASSSCSISVNVTGTTTGVKNNITGVVSATESGPGTTSNTASLTVNTRATSTTISPLTATAPIGGSAPFTITVTDTDGGPVSTPGGTVTVSSSNSSDTISACNLAPSVAGSATCTANVMPAAPAGTHTISASYVATDSVHTSSSAATAAMLTVINAATTTTVTSSPSSPVFGQPVTFTATVTPLQSGLGTPAGMVQFVIDGTNFGGAVTLSAAGTATSNATSTLAVGSHTITATYAPAANSVYQTSTGSLTQTVSQDGTATMIMSSPNPSTFGQTVMITVTVAASAPGGGTPTGTVSFMIDSAPATVLTLVGGSATTSTSSLSIGNHTFTANYSGDGNFTASMASAMQMVNQATTSTALMLNPSTINFGESTTVTATVSPQYGGTPTGTVTVSDGIGNATGDSCTITLASGTGTCVLTPSATAPGGSTVTGNYSGDPSFQGSTGTASLIVNAATTQTTLSTSLPNGSTLGQAVAFTAIVKDTSSGDSAVPNGTVNFFDGGTTLIGSAPLNSGSATFTTSLLSSAASPHSITASFIGNADFSASMTSSAVSQTVNPRSTTTAVILTPATVVVGQGSTVTATVSDVTTYGPSGTPGAFVLTTNSLSTGRTGQASTLLPNGTVLIAGGEDTSGNVLNTAVIYDPVAGTFTTLSGMLTAYRTGATATQLLDGTVLIAGGSNSSNPALGGAEIYDPVAGTFTPLTASLSSPRFGHTATLLPNGTVLIAGGQNGTGTLNTMEVFNPSGSTFAAIGDTLNSARQGHTATLLLNGTILFAGGSGLASAEIYDPVAHTSTPLTSSMTTDRTNHAAALLPDGNVLIAGGTSSSSGGAVNSTELYNTAAGIFNKTSSVMTAARTGLTATMLDSAQVLVVGGSNSTYPALASAELYTPSFDPLGTVSVSSSDNTDNVTPSTCTLNLSGTGATTCQVTDTPSEVGSNPHTITGTYNPAPDQVHTKSSSSTALTVNPAPTSTAVSSSADPSIYGQSVTFTATVTNTGSTATPTGTVQFYVDGSVFGSAVAVSGSGATVTATSGAIATLTVNGGTAHTVTANYVNSDGNFVNSTGSLTGEQTVKPAPTSTTVSSSQNPSIFGQSLTFTATVMNTAGSGVSTATPTGSVQFYVDGAAFGSSVTISGSGASATGTSGATATLTVSGSPHTIKATFTNSDGNFSGSYGSVSQTVQPAPTSTTVSSSVNPSIFGQSLTFTATVANTAGAGVSTATPTGSVQFYIDGTAFGSPVAVSGSGATATGASGATATLTVSGSPHKVKAVYTNSDGNFSGSYGWLGGGQTVNPAPTSTSVSSSVNPSTYGQSVTFTATVMNTAGVSVSTATPTGSVQFVVDGSNFGSPVTVTGSGATAMSQATATLTVNGGTAHTVTANYVNSDGDFSNTTGSLTGGQTVNKADTTSVVSSSNNPSVYGQSVMFTARVSDISLSSTGTPTGTVTFMDGGTTILASGVALYGGQATFATSALVAATHSITAVYSGDGNFNGTGMGASTDPALSQTVNPASTTTAAAPAAAVYGQPNSITLSAMVTANPPSTATVNEGSVTFVVSSGMTQLGTASGAVSSGSASASFSVTGIPAGTYYTITATYNPGPDFNTSSGTSTLTISQATTTTTVTSSSPKEGTPVTPTSTYMQAVTFTATVAPPTGYSGTPSGSVNFYDAVTGETCANAASSYASTAIGGTLTLQTTSGTTWASVTTASLAGGSHTVLACYSGDSNFFGSSGTVQQNVTPAPVVTLTPLNIAFMGQNVGTTSKAAAVILSNVGDAPLDVSTISPAPGVNSNGFSETNNCGSMLGYPGQSSGPPTYCTINVTFAPADTGAANATLAIDDNDQNNGSAEQDVALSGSGLSTLAGGSFYNNAIFATANACGSVTLSGNSSIDSFNSAQGFSSSHALSGGNVGTNGNASLSGNAAIYGTLADDYSTSTGNCSNTSITGLSTNGNAKVTGEQIALNGPINYPAPPAPNPAPPTTNQNISGSCPSGMTGCTNGPGSKTVTLTPGSYGNVSASGGTTVLVSQGTYNLNTLTLSGNSILQVTTGPVIVNLVGASMSGGSPAMDLSGGSIEDPLTPASLQFFYGGSHGINLSGGATSYATVYAPNAIVNMGGGSDLFGGFIGGTFTDSGNSAIHYDTNLTNIPQGDYIWFSAVVNNVVGLSATQQAILYFTNSTISFTATSAQCTGVGGTFNSSLGTCAISVPNGIATLNSTNTSALNSAKASTSYSITNNRWSTNVAPGEETGNTFIAGVAILVPTGGFPAGLQNVQWSAAISTDTPSITSLQWHWSAGVYTTFNPCYAYQSTGSGNCHNSSSNSNVLGANPEDGSADINGSDAAGTPENYKQYLTGAGFFSAPGMIVPTAAEMSTAPSSYSFGMQSVTKPTGVILVSVLTNNDTNPHTISSTGIAMKGTNAADFALQPSSMLGTNCVGMTSLAPGGSCNLYVVFTPSTTGVEEAKIVITDDANNSPQTVYLSGTGQ